MYSTAKPEKSGLYLETLPITSKKEQKKGGNPKVRQLNNTEEENTRRTCLAVKTKHKKVDESNKRMSSDDEKREKKERSEGRAMEMSAHNSHARVLLGRDCNTSRREITSDFTSRIHTTTTVRLVIKRLAPDKVKTAANAHGLVYTKGRIPILLSNKKRISLYAARERERERERRAGAI